MLFRVVLRVPLERPSAVEPFAAAGPQAHVALAAAVGCGPAGRATLRGERLRLCGGAPLGRRRARQRHGRSARRCRPARRSLKDRLPWFTRGERRRSRRLLRRQGRRRRSRKQRRHMHLMRRLRRLHRRRLRRLRRLRCRRLLQLIHRLLPLAPSHRPPLHGPERAKAQQWPLASGFGTGGLERHMPRPFRECVEPPRPGTRRFPGHRREDAFNVPRHGCCGSI